jgi:hypothetical protein
MTAAPRKEPYSVDATAKVRRKIGMGKEKGGKKKKICRICPKYLVCKYKIRTFAHERNLFRVRAPVALASDLLK